MDSLSGSDSVVGGGSRSWSVAGADSGSGSVAGWDVVIRSAVEVFSCCLGHSGLGQLIPSGAGREIATGVGISAWESEIMASLSTTPD